METSNLEHRTLNTEVKAERISFSVQRSAFGVRSFLQF